MKWVIRGTRRKFAGSLERRGGGGGAAIDDVGGRECVKGV